MSKKEPENLLDILEGEQLPAVTDTFSENSVVAAGAGSGKTYVLARRFAWLVCEKDIPVDRILTLTFTKKAAAEMYQRIYKTLVSFSQKLTGVQQERAAAAVRDFSKARIQTLDSYCSTVIKPKVHEYGIRPDYSTDVTAAQEAIQKLALPFVLKHQDNPALQALISTRKPQETAAGVFADTIIRWSTLSNPIDFMDDFERQCVEIKKQLETSTWEISETLNLIHEDVINYSSNAASMLERKEKILQLLESGSPIIPDVSMPPVNEEEQNRAITDCLSNLAYIAASKVYLSDHINDLRKQFERFSSLINFVYHWSMLSELNKLLEEFQKECDTIRRTQGFLTFNDAASLAITVLTEDKEMRQAEKAAYDKIMIDEFQDNNEQQRNLLYLLSEKPELFSKGIPSKENLVDGKLFFVGDEKQSIYKFRGAEVSVFNNLKDDLAKNLSLSLNFRSHPALIAAFNTLFGGYPYPKQITQPYSPGDVDPDLPAIFKKNSIMDYEAGYNPALVPSVKFDDNGPSFSCDPHIHVGMILSAQTRGKENNGSAEIVDELKDVESEAVWTAAKIKELIAGGRKAGDITILLKTLTNQRKFERYLRQAGIPYASEAVSGFYDDSPINDITACLRWCVYPADRISYAILLKSPFVRLSDNAMRCVLAGQSISAEEQARLDDAMNRLNAFKTELEHISIAEAVTRLWYTLGYQFETRWNGTVILYSELYDFLFELACRADANNKTVSWFVDYLQSLSDENRKLEDMDIPLERKDAVHIMTIHKSKGLEFPVVFLSNTSFHPNNMEAAAPVFYSKDWGISINTGTPRNVENLSSTVGLKNNYFYNESQKLDKLKERAELDRVLYVGITRACEELYITGCTADPQFALSASSAQKDADGEYIPRNIYALMRPLYEYYSANPEKAPFSLEMHPLYTRDEADVLLSLSRNTRANTAKARTALADEAAPLFEAAPAPVPYISTKQTWNPSHLGISEAADGNAGTQDAATRCPVKENTPPDPAIFNQIDALVKDVPAFTNAHFGTLAHAAIEAAYTGEPLKIKGEIAAVLTGSQREKVIALARRLAPSFVDSSLGQLALRATWRQNEYDFKMKLPASENSGGVPVTVKGQIDLLFETEEHGEPVIYIVDFKTDSAEKPEEHVSQLACYSHAARQMRGQKKTRCWLFYLRSGHAVEITSETDKIRLQDFAPLPPEQPAQPQ